MKPLHGLLALLTLLLPAQGRAELPSLDSFAVQLERPLFAPDRHGVPEAGSATAGQAAASGALRLIGIALDAGGRQVALLGRDGGTPPIRALVGDQVDGWRIERVSPDGIEAVAGPLRRRVALGARLPAANGR